VSDFERTPPHNLGAEQSVLGGMLLSAEAVRDVAGTLEARDFYRPAHALVYAAITDLSGRGEPADAVAVSAELQARGEITRVGGAPYLHTLIAGVATWASAGYYARIVRERAVLRRLTEAGTRIVQFAYDGTGDVGEITSRARTELDEAISAADGGADLRSMADLTEDFIGSLEQEAERGLTTGLRDLDEVTLGLAAGQLVIVAGRPGMGKSVLGATVAHHVGAKLAEPVLFASLEMSEQELTARLLSAEARVPLHDLLSRRLNVDEWQRIEKARPRLLDSRLVIDYAPSASVASIRRRLDAMARTAPARLLVVDYLGLLAGSKAENRQQEVAGVSRDLKRLAGDYGIPVIACAQLNRNPEGRPDKRPQMSDLRDSGAQEQDADIVILLHREDAYEPASPRAGEIDLIVAKHRQGPLCTITAAFQGHYTRIADMAPIAWSASAMADDA
jgi:replicative DNA helicase